MKKLIFVFLLMAGLFVNTDAQTMQYVVYNASSTVYDFKMADSNGNEAEELNIAPGEERNGGWVGFMFDFYWKGANSFGCDFNNQASGPVTETTVGFPCFPPASYTYKIVQVGFNDYVFKISLN